MTMIRSSTRDARAARGAKRPSLSPRCALTKIDSVTMGLPLRAIIPSGVGRGARLGVWRGRGGMRRNGARAARALLRAFPDASHRSSGSSARGRGWAGVAWRVGDDCATAATTPLGRGRAASLARCPLVGWTNRTLPPPIAPWIVASFATRAATEPASSPPKLKGITTRPNGRVSVRVSGGGVKQKTVGTFDTLEEALAAYNVEAVKRGVPTQTLPPARRPTPRRRARATPSSPTSRPPPPTPPKRRHPLPPRRSTSTTPAPRSVWTRRFRRATRTMTPMRWSGW